MRPLDPLDRRVLGGLVAVMIAEPGRTRDTEWMAEQLVRLAVVAHGFAENGDAATPAHVATIQDYARSRRPDIVAVALQLFVRTADDLRQRPGFGFDDARAVVAGYLT